MADSVTPERRFDEAALAAREYDILGPETSDNFPAIEYLDSFQGVVFHHTLDGCYGFATVNDQVHRSLLPNTIRGASKDFPCI